jgi:hypothetical protein
MRNNNFNHAFKAVMLFCFIVLSTSGVKAQLTGTRNIPGDYATLDLAIADLNTQGVGAGGVTINLLAGNPQTAPAGGYTITTAGSLVDPIVLTGNGNTITASNTLVAGQLFDGIIKIIGTDNITVQGFTLQENAANTTTAAATNNMTEWGVAVLYATTTNNAQNVKILNNTISLGATYQNTFGIYSNATHTATTVTTSATASTATGGNSGLEVKGNTISAVNLGIVVIGPTAAADHTDGVTIGGATPAEGNTITYGLTGTFSAFANVSGTVNGVLVRNAKNVTVRNNSLTSNGTVTAGTLNGIQFPAFSNTPTGTFTQTVSNNAFDIRSNAVGSAVNGINQPGGSASATSTFICDNNDFNNIGHTIAAPTGALQFIILTSTHQTNSISGNRFNNLTVTTTGSVTFISNSITTPVGGTQTINNNQIVGTFSKTGAGGTVVLFTTGSFTGAGRTIAFTNNNFSNITLTGATTMSGVVLNDGNAATDGPVKTITGNTFNNWTCGTNAVQGMLQGFAGNTAPSVIENNVFSNITGQGNVTGVNLGSSGNIDFRNNQIFGLSSTGTGTTVSVVGVSANTGNLVAKIQRNRLFNLSANAATNTTTNAVSGISVAGGTTVNVENNLISGLTANVAPATDGVRGISITSTVATSSVNVYHNTVYLNAVSSGINFGTSGIFHSGSTTATTAQLSLRNNVIINESTPAGTGQTVAFRRGTVNATNLALASNRNLLFAGTPGISNLIYTDGTTPLQTLLNYQAAILPIGHDINSFTGEAFVYGTPGSFFISLTGGSVDFLKPVAGITTQAESGADAIAGLTVDYDGVTRPASGTSPDVGAFEFAGISPTPIITLNSVTPPATTQCTAAARLVSVNITTSSGTITGANLFYTVNGVPQTNIVMTNPSGTTWTATIPVPTPANATITWGVTATNSIGLNGSFTGTAYSDEPLTGITAGATASATTVCSGTAVNLTALINNPAASTLYTTPSITSPVTDEDIRTVTITQGASTLLNNTSAINSLVGTLGTATGTAGSYSNYTSFGSTTLTGGQTYTLFVASIDAPGFFTNFATAFIDYNRDGDFADAGESIVPATGQLFNAAVDNGNDSISVSFTVPASAIDGLTRMRVAVTETGQTNAAGVLNNGFGEFEDYTILISGATPGTTNNITSVSWADGVTPVGTGNPLTINPTSTATYTATITAFGCTVAPAPTTTVTVTPLPTAPTAANSAQCGTQIPTASVTSTTGLPTPTFVWYSLPVAGVVMQSGTSTTYTSNVTATTTFYVSELNTVTGCESPRTAVTVTVATADGVSASTSAPTICIGSSVTLTAANTNPTPNQSYTYTWSSTANSGASTPVAGSPAVITPTQPGTYTYNLAAVDGGCNAVATVNVTVNPFVATLAPINVSCNGYANGSFSVASSSCGTLPYTYSIGGGAFGAIPTNLAPGTYSVVVQDNNGYQTTAQNVVITQPSTTIAAPTGTNATVCQGDLTAPVSASSVTNTPTPASVVVNFTVAAQPTELSASTTPATVAASPNAIATATMAALPAGAVVTGATLNYNNIVALGNSWQSDVRLGLVGAVTQNYSAGSAVNGAGTFNYASTIPAGSVNVAGGTITMHYFDFFNDNAGDESTFPTGSNVASITINYTVPTPASITWWTASSAGTQIGSGSPFETVGTSVLPNTNTPGVYTVYAQGEFGGCNGLTRTPVTVTVNAPSASTTTITACGSYIWTNGTTYTASGIHTQTLVNAAGCDSIATLNLTINQPTSSTVTVSACSSYTWAQNGTTYTTSGSYPVVLAGANAAGCDSTVTLNLTINQPTSSTVTVSACGSYTWAQNATTYTTSGSYPVVLAGANANGCDSTITLNLTINQPTSSTVTVTACGSYSWAENTTTYTTSGSYPVVLAGANANGCDSTITLNLTINQPTSSSVTEVACGSYTWAENTTTYTTSGTYVTTLAGANANGCDSTITLNLTINQPTSSTVTATACESYTWAENGTTYTASGSYPVVLAGANANGCDSTVTLVLTITGLPTATATDNDDATITASAGASYQWIDCATNTAIAGATSQTYTATVNGDYAVVVTNAGGCSDTSSCVTIDYIGLTENTDASIQVFPNPTNSDVTITMTATEATVEVVDAQGKILQAVTVSNGEKVNLSTYETGVYFLRIRTVNGSTLERVVKQQ